MEAVRDDAYFKETTAKIVATRERVKEELKKLRFTFPDSKANFIFAFHEKIPVRRLFLVLAGIIMGLAGVGLFGALGMMF